MNMLYFILPDPPNLQEIAKRTEKQHISISRPKPPKTRTKPPKKELRKSPAPLRSAAKGASQKKVWSRPDTI